MKKNYPTVFNTLFLENLDSEEIKVLQQQVVLEKINIYIG